MIKTVPSLPEIWGLISPHKIKLEKGIERKENTPVDSMESLIEIINGQDHTMSGDLELIIDITMRGFDAMKVTVCHITVFPTFIGTFSKEIIERGGRLESDLLS